MPSENKRLNERSPRILNRSVHPPEPSGSPAVMDIEAHRAQAAADLRRHPPHQFVDPDPGLPRVRDPRPAAVRAHRDQPVLLAQFLESGPYPQPLLRRFINLRIDDHEKWLAVRHFLPDYGHTEPPERLGARTFINIFRMLARLHRARVHSRIERPKRRGGDLHHVAADRRRSNQVRPPVRQRKPVPRGVAVCDLHRAVDRIYDVGTLLVLRQQFRSPAFALHDPITI